ncbi:2-oxo acid dehydrogenase subunit E2, partial [Acidimicrobiaceae bacterium USS-CC1]|nr:2-oxo acid dehydrogenase subunit E2 [Acidiferrimicrobium australe]
AGPAEAGAPAPAAAPAATAPAPAPAPAAGDRQASLRRAIGALMARSKREIPHFYLATTIDLGAVSSWLERTNAERPVPRRLVASALLLAAAARAVARAPELNGFFVDGGFRPGSGVHLGVAVSLRSGGVVAPAIHDADRLDPDQMMAALHDLVGRARAGTLRSSEMSDPTVTVTNLGDLGVDSVFGVIYPPQAALIGFGRVAERAVVRAGEVVAAPCVTASLAADHRVSDGHRAGRLLADIDRFLQRPEDL